LLERLFSILGRRRQFGSTFGLRLWIRIGLWKAGLRFDLGRNG
jgi:hypothetical protein